MPAMAWQILLSLAAVALIVAAVQWSWRDQPPAPLSEADARAVAGHALGGFARAETAIDQAARVAILLGAGGRIAIVCPHGAHFLAHALAAGSTAQVDGTAIALTLGGSGRTFRIELGDAAPDWAARINALS